MTSRVYQATWDPNNTICPTVEGYSEVVNSNMQPIINMLVDLHGEQYRRLIEDAVPFLICFAQKHTIELSIPETIADLVKRARVTPVSTNTAPSD